MRGRRAIRRKWKNISLNFCGIHLIHLADEVVWRNLFYRFISSLLFSCLLFDLPEKLTKEQCTLITAGRQLDLGLEGRLGRVVGWAGPGLTGEPVLIMW